MMRKVLLIILISFLVTNIAIAGDPEAGKAKSQACVACHGQDGNSAAPIYPNLAGQYANYLLQALQDYKSGARKDPIMTGMVASLTEGDMADLAAFYAAQEGLSALGTN